MSQSRSLSVVMPLLCGACLWSAASALAEPKKQQANKVRWKDMPSATSKEYKRFDTNRDGALDEKEIKNIRDTFARNPTDATLLPYDRDDDKKLSDKEIAGIPSAEIDLKALEKMQSQKNQKNEKPKKKKK